MCPDCYKYVSAHNHKTKRMIAKAPSVLPGQRICYRCEQSKPESEFVHEAIKRKRPALNCRECREYMKNKADEYRKAWTPERRTQDVEYKRQRQASLRAAALAAYGNKCACCGETTPEFLGIDHVNNDGSAHRKEMGTPAIYLWLAQHDYPQGRFQALCWNCNLSKGFFGMCPHQRGKLKVVS